jgi:nucleoside diphosphate kinase
MPCGFGEFQLYSVPVNAIHQRRKVMSSELAFVLINPYTIAKSRTGGVIARYVGRTDLRLVATRMIGPSQALVEKYAELLRTSDPEHKETADLLADYVLRSYTPNPITGKPRRVMLLLFEGEDAINKIWRITGSSTSRTGSGETIRDTYGDYVKGANGEVQYFEPAVLVAPSRKRAGASMRLWAHYSSIDGGIIDSATDVPTGERVEKTLVMLKPDNFRIPSLRAGNIIDVLSSAGLRIVGTKKFSMTVAQAEDFYGPVKGSLEKKFKENGAGRIADALSRELGFKVTEDTVKTASQQIASLFAQEQFESIVNFMTGYRPSACKDYEKKVLGKEDCVALVYEGVDAVTKIRTLLGSTDPSKAQPGSVRREFGSDIMVNAAHASDSPENARREMRIIEVEKDFISQCVDKYYGNAFSKLKAMGKQMPKTLCEMRRGGDDDGHDE